MAQHTGVPKFGDWESADNVPYTQYFDNARKGKSGKLINPNDPQENPEVFSEETSPIHSVPFRIGSDADAPKSKHERRPSREESDQCRAMGSPLRHEVVARKYALDSPHHRYGDRKISGETQRRTSRQSGGSDRSVEQSPVHPHSHVKSASKGGVSSPSWERRGSSEGHGHGSNTPGRSRLKPGSRDYDNSEKGLTVPKFGAWDESDPASADEFSQIFNKVREEKHTSSTKVPVVSNESSYPNHTRARSYVSLSCCCFGSRKKHEL